jgi:cell volume regulation protein A
MHLSGSEIIFFAALLVVISIVISTVSNRVGAPLLLVFLVLGMITGEDGPGGVRFDDYNVAYLVGSLALAIILFDGGLRTTRHAFEVALWPSLVLAVPGVVITAGITGLAAAHLLGYDWQSGLLVGSIVAPTDAAAVFFLLRLGGTELRRRLGATLEIESGLNDPMAIFLTFACIEILSMGHVRSSDLIVLFVSQLAGGMVIGVAAGHLLLALINRIEIAGGLYPVLAGASALAVFGGAQAIGASGFLAVYVAGFVVGNRRHRAAKGITRFHDGLAWLSQIGMFLMLGLLVTPHRLFGNLPAALGIAVVLMFVARPVATWLCLVWFRFTLPEIAFVSWVGLRGAVPIFLATAAVLAGLPHGAVYFDVAFVVVLISLLAQGWTVTSAARFLGLTVPAVSDEADRLELDVLVGLDRDFTAYRVAGDSEAAELPFERLPLPRRARIIAVIRDGALMERETLPTLAANDYVLAVAPPEQLFALDNLFAPQSRRQAASEQEAFGEFSLQADATVGAIADLYGFPAAAEDRPKTLATFLAGRLPRHPAIGDRVRVEPVEFVVRDLHGQRILRVGIEVEPVKRRWSLRRSARQALTRMRRRAR